MWEFKMEFGNDRVEMWEVDFLIPLQKKEPDRNPAPDLIQSYEIQGKYAGEFRMIV
jgi:hypothetical protein